jgi:hypothetical protein
MGKGEYYGVALGHKILQMIKLNLVFIRFSKLKIICLDQLFDMKFALLIKLMKKLEKMD